MTLHFLPVPELPATALQTFFRLAWDGFLRHSCWEGPDLQDALVKSGLCEGRVATEGGADFEAGDTIIVLSDAGKAALR